MIRQQVEQVAPTLTQNFLSLNQHQHAKEGRKRGMLLIIMILCCLQALILFGNVNVVEGKISYKFDLDVQSWIWNRLDYRNGDIETKILGNDTTPSGGTVISSNIDMSKFYISETFALNFTMCLSGNCSVLSNPVFKIQMNNFKIGISIFNGNEWRYLESTSSSYHLYNYVEITLSSNKVDLIFNGLVYSNRGLFSSSAFFVDFVKSSSMLVIEPNIQIQNFSLLLQTSSSSFKCFDIPSDDPSVCSGVGVCTEANVCLCPLGGSVLDENCFPLSARPREGYFCSMREDGNCYDMVGTKLEYTKETLFVYSYLEAGPYCSNLADYDDSRCRSESFRREQFSIFQTVHSAGYSVPSTTAKEYNGTAMDILLVDENTGAFFPCENVYISNGLKPNTFAVYLFEGSKCFNTDANIYQMLAREFTTSFFFSPSRVGTNMTLFDYVNRFKVFISSDNNIVVDLSPISEGSQMLIENTFKVNSTYQVTITRMINTNTTDKFELRLSGYNVAQSTNQTVHVFASIENFTPTLQIGSNSDGSWPFFGSIGGFEYTPKYSAASETSSDATKIVMCFDIESTDIRVCSGHGSCTRNNTCICGYGYKGDNCEVLITCGGVSANDAQVCSGQGDCIAVDTCICKFPYSGKVCSINEKPQCSNQLYNGFETSLDASLFYQMKLFRIDFCAEQPSKSTSFPLLRQIAKKPSNSLDSFVDKLITYQEYDGTFFVTVDKSWLDNNLSTQPEFYVSKDSVDKTSKYLVRIYLNNYATTGGFTSKPRSLRLLSNSNDYYLLTLNGTNLLIERFNNKLEKTQETSIDNEYFSSEIIRYGQAIVSVDGGISFYMSVKENSQVSNQKIMRLSIQNFDLRLENFTIPNNPQYLPYFFIFNGVEQRIMTFGTEGIKIYSLSSDTLETQLLGKVWWDFLNSERQLINVFKTQNYIGLYYTETVSTYFMSSSTQKIDVILISADDLTAIQRRIDPVLPNPKYYFDSDSYIVVPKEIYSTITVTNSTNTTNSIIDTGKNGTNTNSGLGASNNGNSGSNASSGSNNSSSSTDTSSSSTVCYPDGSFEDFVLNLERKYNSKFLLTLTIRKISICGYLFSYKKQNITEVTINRPISGGTDSYLDKLVKTQKMNDTTILSIDTSLVDEPIPNVIIINPTSPPQPITINVPLNNSTFNSTSTRILSNGQNFYALVLTGPQLTVYQYHPLDLTVPYLTTYYNDIFTPDQLRYGTPLIRSDGVLSFYMPTANSPTVQKLTLTENSASLSEVKIPNKPNGIPYFFIFDGFDESIVVINDEGSFFFTINATNLSDSTSLYYNSSSVAFKNTTRVYQTDSAIVISQGDGSSLIAPSNKSINPVERKINVDLLPLCKALYYDDVLYQLNITNSISSASSSSNTVSNQTNGSSLPTTQNLNSTLPSGLNDTGSISNSSVYNNGSLSNQALTSGNGSLTGSNNSSNVLSNSTINQSSNTSMISNGSTLNSTSGVTTNNTSQNGFSNSSISSNSSGNSMNNVNGSSIIQNVSNSSSITSNNTSMNGNSSNTSNSTNSNSNSLNIQSNNSSGVSNSSYFENYSNSTTSNVTSNNTSVNITSTISNYTQSNSISNSSVTANNSNQSLLSNSSTSNNSNSGNMNGTNSSSNNTSLSSSNNTQSGNNLNNTNLSNTTIVDNTTLNQQSALNFTSLISNNTSNSINNSTNLNGNNTTMNDSNGNNTNTSNSSNIGNNSTNISSNGTISNNNNSNVINTTTSLNNSTESINLNNSSSSSNHSISNNSTTASLSENNSTISNNNTNSQNTSNETSSNSSNSTLNSTLIENENKLNNSNSNSSSVNIDNRNNLNNSTIPSNSSNNIGNNNLNNTSPNLDDKSTNTNNESSIIISNSTDINVNVSNLTNSTINNNITTIISPPTRNNETNQSIEVTPKVICFGVDQKSNLTCSGNGECISNDTCKCLPNYIGSDCSIAVCFGISGANSSVCNGNGKCIGADLCDCKDGFTGQLCQYQTVTELCTGSFVPAEQITVISSNIYLQKSLIDTVCGKSLVLQSTTLLEDIPSNVTNSNLLKYYTITNDKDNSGDKYLTFDTILYKSKIPNSLIIWKIDKFSNATQMIIPISNAEEGNSTYGLVKILDNPNGDLLGITLKDNSTNVTILEIDTSNKEANISSVFSKGSITFSDIDKGNQVFNPSTNTTTFTFFKEGTSNSSLLLSLNLETPTETPKEVVIPQTTQKYFTLVLFDYPDQYLLSSDQEKTTISTIVPDITSDAPQFNPLASDSNFIVNKDDLVVLTKDSEKITVVNVNTDVSLIIAVSQLTPDPSVFDQSTQFTKSQPIAYVSNDQSESTVLSIRKIYPLYVPISGSIPIYLEGNFVLPGTKPYLILKYTPLDLIVASLPIQLSGVRSSQGTKSFVNFKDISSILPSELGSMDTFKVSVQIQLISENSDPISISTSTELTLYKFDLLKVLPKQAYYGDNILAVATFFPPNNDVNLFIRPQFATEETQISCTVLNSTICSAKLPMLPSSDTLLNVRASLSQDLVSSSYENKLHIRYVDPDVVKVASLDNFDTSVSPPEDIPDQDSTPPIVERKESIDSIQPPLILKMNIGKLNKSKCTDKPIRQVVASSDLHDISNVISLDFKLSPFSNIENGNLIEFWISKKLNGTFFGSLAFENGKQVLTAGELSSGVKSSTSCTFTSGVSYRISMKLSSSRTKWEVKNINIDMIECSLDFSSDNSKILENPKSYQFGIGQSFSCAQLLSNITQIPDLTVNSMMEVCSSCAKPVFSIDQQDFMPYIVGGSIGLVILVALIATSLVAASWYLIRRRRRNTVGKYIYYDNNANRENTLEDLFEKINTNSSVDSVPTTTDDFVGEDEDVGDFLSKGGVTYNTWV